MSTPPLQAHLVGNENQKGACWLTLEGDYCCHSQQVYTLKPHVSLAHGGALALVVDSCDPSVKCPQVCVVQKALISSSVVLRLISQVLLA